MKDEVTKPPGDEAPIPPKKRGWGRSLLGGFFVVGLSAGGLLAVKEKQMNWGSEGQAGGSLASESRSAAR